MPGRCSEVHDAAISPLSVSFVCIIFARLLRILSGLSLCPAWAFAAEANEASVTVGNVTTEYASLTDAWAALVGKSGTLRLLKSVVTTEPLTVSAGMKVRVEMENGVTLTNNTSDCFQIKNFGTLTLTESCTVVKGGSSNSWVYAESGTLNVEGGSYTNTAPNGNGMYASFGVTVQISGGTFTVVSGQILLRSSQAPYSKTVSTMLKKGYALSVGSNQVPLGELDVREFKSNGGTYTVALCDHDGALTSNNNGTHNISCPYCGNTDAAENCAYKFTGTTGTCICGDSVTVAVSGTDNLIYDGTEKKPEVTVTRSGTALEAGQYTVSYDKNISAGTATVTVTIGNGTYTQAFTIGKATLTVTGATATDRAYNGTNEVSIKAVALEGVATNDDVSVDTTNLKGTVNGCPQPDWKRPTERCACLCRYGCGQL